MKLKTGDKVKILAGKDKGKTGKVLQVFIKEERAVVEGLNLAIKHQKPKKQGEKGQRIQYPAPIQISSLAMLCPKCGQATRVGYQINISDNKKIKSRVCQKCKEVI